ncbi:MAG: KTSC domain-containing protein [Anaerolineae bacterium]
MIHAIGYDKDKRILEIVFSTGRAYQYGDVPPEEYQGLLNAESKGRYFLANIRDMYAYWPVGRARRRGE